MRIKKMKKITALSVVLILLSSMPVSAAPQSPSMQVSNGHSANVQMQGTNNGLTGGNQAFRDSRREGAPPSIPMEALPQNANQAPPEIKEMLPVPQGMEGIDSRTLQPELNPNVLRQTQAEQSGISVSTEYDYIEILGGVTQTDYDAFMNYLEMVDDSILERFESEGWKLIVTDADLDQLLFNGSTNGVAGCTYFDSHVIYVNSSATSYCVIHEMGHFLDYIYDFASDEDVFTTIFNAEAASLTEYGQTSSEEFFAELYMYAILENENTQAACPNGYTYVRNCVDQLELVTQ